MKSSIIMILFCFGVTLTSSDLCGIEITSDGGKNVWFSYDYNLFLQFNSPSGKTFYIDYNDGTIYRERNSTSTTFRESDRYPQSEATVTPTELHREKELPFISFLSADFKIYDIYFDSDNSKNQNPRLEKVKALFPDWFVFIHFTLHSFVGPNNKLYEVIYNDAYEINIIEKSSEVLDHFQIKTFGAYDKWEHTYDFSENGELIVDHTIAPIPVQADRFIPLPEHDPSIFIDYVHTFVKFYTDSGSKYHITNNLNIIPIREDVNETAYITFIEPNGQTFDVNIDEKDGSASLVEKTSNEIHEKFNGKPRLHSFVTPNGVLFRIDHRNDSDHGLPILVQDSDNSSDLQITVVNHYQFHNKFVKYTFLQNGKKLFDRVDEIDWTPLNEQPALPVEEVTADYLMANLPFLTLYTSSGNNYHIFTSGTNASIAVERGAPHSQSLYISYFQKNGRKTYIHFVTGTDPYLKEETELTGKEYAFSLLSFTTPDKKYYSIVNRFGDDKKWKDSCRIQRPLLPYKASKVKEPLDLYMYSEDNVVDGLSITVEDGLGFRYAYNFTWNGDILVKASSTFPSKLPTIIGK